MLFLDLCAPCSPSNRPVKTCESHTHRKASCYSKKKGTRGRQVQEGAGHNILRVGAGHWPRRGHVGDQGGPGVWTERGGAELGGGSKKAREISTKTHWADCAHSCYPCHEWHSLALSANLSENSCSCPALCMPAHLDLELLGLLRVELSNMVASHSLQVAKCKL